MGLFRKNNSAVKKLNKCKTLNNKMHIYIKLNKHEMSFNYFKDFFLSSVRDDIQNCYHIKI